MYDVGCRVAVRCYRKFFDYLFVLITLSSRNISRRLTPRDPPSTRRLRLASAMIRSVFLSGLGVIFLVAFVSYHLQFPGINSSSGIEPAGRIFPYVFPQIYSGKLKWPSVHFHKDTTVFWYEVDVLCETASLLGIIFSIIASR